MKRFKNIIFISLVGILVILIAKEFVRSVSSGNVGEEFRSINRETSFNFELIPGTFQSVVEGKREGIIINFLIPSFWQKKDDSHLLYESSDEEINGHLRIDMRKITSNHTMDTSKVLRSWINTLSRSTKEPVIVYTEFSDADSISIFNIESIGMRERVETRFHYCVYQTPSHIAFFSISFDETFSDVYNNFSNNIVRSLRISKLP